MAFAHIISPAPQVAVVVRDQLGPVTSNSALVSGRCLAPVMS